MVFLKYVVVGVLGTGLDVCSLYFFVEYVKLELLPATTFAFLISATNNFFLNKKWTFQNRSKNIRKLYIKYLLVACFGLLLTNFSMYMMVVVGKLWYIFSKLLTSGIVLVWNFLANKYWTFSLRHDDAKRWSIENNHYDLSIIIPAFNEEKRITATLTKIYSYLKTKNLKTEIIVVDDGSTDQTNQKLNEWQIGHLSEIFFHSLQLTKNQGKGFAIREGVKAAIGKHILIADADSSTPIEELEKLLPYLQQKYDIAIGSRYIAGSNVIIEQPFYRIALSRIGNWLIRLFLINDIKDTQCGFKLFTQESAKEIYSLQKVARWGFDMEVLAIAQLLNYKIIEIPVSWINSPDSRLRPIRDAAKTFWELIYIKLNIWSGRYNKD